MKDRLCGVVYFVQTEMDSRIFRSCCRSSGFW